MKFNPKVGDLVYFRWDDHCSYSHAGWKPISGMLRELGGAICETTGFVIEITPASITTAGSLCMQKDQDDDCSQISTRLRRTITGGKIIKRFPRPKDV